ncbi:MAG: hypothetical protein VYE73_03895 [Acidobacteriota bacterium]|nr:hypothetical protein [Acidobacteriota bacterium]
MKSPSRTASCALIALVVLVLPAAAQQELPSPTEILDRYVEALGGEAAIRKHEQVTWTAKLEIPGMGIEADATLAAAAPNKFRLTMESDAMGSVDQGFDGQIAWSDTAMTGPMILEGAEREDAVLLADFHADVNYAINFPLLETVAEEDFDDETAYKVRAETATGRETFHFFSVETGLLIGSEGNQATAMGELFATSRIGDYKEYDGRLFPTELIVEVMGAQQVIRLIEPDFSVIDASVFEPPEAIKTLAAG